MLRHVRRRGAFCGVDTRADPQDFASNSRSHRAATALQATVPASPPWEWLHGRLSGTRGE